jgi:hypothetical protein
MWRASDDSIYTMKDDLQDQIDSQLKKVAGKQPEAINVDIDNDNFVVRGRKGTFAASQKNPTVGDDTNNTSNNSNSTIKKDEDPEIDIPQGKTFDLSTIELASTPLKNVINPVNKAPAPKSIADLLKLEKEVAKNPPKAVPHQFPQTPEKPKEAQKSTQFFPSSVPRPLNSPIPTETTETTSPEKNIESEVGNLESAKKEDDSIQERVRQSVKNIEYTPRGDSPVVRKLRTLKGDIEEAMQQGKATLVSVAAAESNRRSEIAHKEEQRVANVMTPPKEMTEVSTMPTKAPQRKSSGTGTKILAIIISVLLIAAGSFGVYYLRKNQGTPVVIIENDSIPKAYIPIQYQVPIEVDGHNPSYIRATFDAERRRTSSKLNEIGEALFLTGEKDKARALTSSEFFRTVSMRPPEALERTLDPHFMAGFHRLGENYAFLIFKTDTYDTARAYMIEWESNLEDEIGLFLRSPKDFEYATSSDAIINRRKFKDKVYKNLDTRVLLGKNDEPLFLYTFINRTYLVMVSNPETLTEIVNGLSTRTNTK